ncbi:pseudouridine synthase [Paenibacillus swuensis]|uniref:RNA pseudouridylate synthase n=1 Tax=Paenibacillus swuensis TaxID=1178515 RepID=A0A172TLP6_9BACL|nr:RNA pseudouridine synthase [Paenibacillus swuensis]ANE47902.1 pseudouridine synthase [Paenibacillus swuensis]
MSGTSPHIQVIYEDNHVLVVDKPVNIPSQEDDSGDLDMLRLLKQDLKIRYDKPGNVYLGLVQRLDRPVGGVMVFAKTSKAASRLSDQVRTRVLHKEYVAVVHGLLPQQTQLKVTHSLLKDTSVNTVKVVPAGTEGAKVAVLDYMVLGVSDGFSLVKITLHTGRPHQIRVQMAALGCPLYGDQKYGASVNKPGQQIALWSTLLSFPHPVTKEQLVHRSYPPQEHPWRLWKPDIYKFETFPNK